MSEVDTVNAALASLEVVGDTGHIAEDIERMLSSTPLFGDFDRGEIRILSSHLKLYRADAGSVVLKEGDPGDFMLLLIDGEVNILKQDSQRRQKLIATVQPGISVGEMSMVDGEPRFATCVATKPSLFAVLTREALVRIIDEHPRLGAKILVQLLAMMNERLRKTGSTLAEFLKLG